MAYHGSPGELIKSEPGSPPMVKCPAVCTPMKLLEKAGSPPCKSYQKVLMSLDLSSLVTWSSLVHWLEVHAEMSRLRQRVFFPRPMSPLVKLVSGFGGVQVWSLKTGPRLTFQSLKGPELTQPPPAPWGILITGESCVGIPQKVWLVHRSPPRPLPPIEVMEPSRAGELAGSSDQRGQL